MAPSKQMASASSLKLNRTSIMVIVLLLFASFITAANFVMTQHIFYGPSVLPVHSQRIVSDEEKFELPTIEQHAIAGLSCEKYGGPFDEAAVEEMVYWRDIPSDSLYVSPFKPRDGEDVKYITFEPDRAGWNNMRMGIETVIAMAHAMGRTLVLPPDRVIWAMDAGKHHQDPEAGKQKKEFSFDEFYHLESLAVEHPGLDIITMDEFLTRVAIEEREFRDAAGNVLLPPGEKTVWDGKPLEPLYDYLREVGMVRRWGPSKCIAGFPESDTPEAAESLKRTFHDVVFQKPRYPTADYIGNPTPVSASAFDRMMELIDGRKELCFYDKEMQAARLVHFKEDYKNGFRLLTHFYGFLFFQDYTQDLWIKRFIRDHLRYNDEIMCAAARVVEAVRQRSKTNPMNPSFEFDSMHVRRNDFGVQYASSVVSAETILENSREHLTPGGTLYIATDERDSSFFDPLRKDYDVVLLNDVAPAVLKGVNSNLFPFIDQLVAARGRVFYGVYLSTFTGYINRLRGYYSTKEHQPRALSDGIINSYHFVKLKNKDVYRKYMPLKLPAFEREFPTCWRDIDQGIEELHNNKEGGQ